jgi:hypothetical protein
LNGINGVDGPPKIPPSGSPPGGGGPGSGKGKNLKSENGVKVTIDAQQIADSTNGLRWIKEISFKDGVNVEEYYNISRKEKETLIKENVSIKPFKNNKLGQYNQEKQPIYVILNFH